jgi:hypothetical protein
MKFSLDQKMVMWFLLFLVISILIFWAMLETHNPPTLPDHVG